MKVLIIDDEPLIRKTLNYAITHRGWTAYAHDERADCARIIKEFGIDVLLIDYQMPAINGLDLIDGLRRSGVTIPAIMLSANAHAIDETRAKQLGVFKILSKPPTLKELMGVLAKAVVKQEKVEKSHFQRP
ncbi:MAG TPA: response regulator [Verrucomicrobiae bacterium]|nr:response regulator [Verrucomicrobiae bacterium]